MTQDEALKLALEALRKARRKVLTTEECHAVIMSIKEALAEQDVQYTGNGTAGREADVRPTGFFFQSHRQAQQEPVAWLITDEKINSLQVDSIQRLIDRARHAHMTDIKLRINGQDEWYQADWLKHLIRATPPQRTWQGLTADELNMIGDRMRTWNSHSLADVYVAIEAKLKEKNT